MDVDDLQRDHALELLMRTAEAKAALQEALLSIESAWRRYPEGEFKHTRRWIIDALNALADANEGRISYPFDPEWRQTESCLCIRGEQCGRCVHPGRYRP